MLHFSTLLLFKWDLKVCARGGMRWRKFVWFIAKKTPTHNNFIFPINSLSRSLFFTHGCRDNSANSRITATAAIPLKQWKIIKFIMRKMNWKLLLSAASTRIMQTFSRNRLLFYILEFYSRNQCTMLTRPRNINNWIK